MLNGCIGESSRLARRMRFTFTPGAFADEFSSDIRPRSHDGLLSTVDIRMPDPRTSEFSQRMKIRCGRLNRAKSSSGDADGILASQISWPSPVDANRHR
jgi:hypothetical protein